MSAILKSKNGCHMEWQFLKVILLGNNEKDFS